MRALLAGLSRRKRGMSPHSGVSEAPRPPRQDGTGTPGLPGKALSFILCPFTPPIPLWRDGARSGQVPRALPVGLHERQG